MATQLRKAAAMADEVEETGSSLQAAAERQIVVMLDINGATVDRDIQDAVFEKEEAKDVQN